MRKSLIAAVGAASLWNLMNAPSAFAERNICNTYYDRCIAKGTDWAECLIRQDKCLGELERERALKQKPDAISGADPKTPPRGEKPGTDGSPGKGGKRASTDPSGWNGKYTTVVIRDKAGTHTFTVKQGVPIEIGLMVLGPDGAKHHIWDPNLGKQLEALGVPAYANDNAAREAFAKARAAAGQTAGGTKTTTRGDGSKIDQTTLNGFGAGTKKIPGGGGATTIGVSASGGAAPGAMMSHGAATPPKTTASQAATAIAIPKPAMSLSPVSNNNRRQLQ